MGERTELQNLVRGARVRDPEALGAIFDRYYPAIYRLAYARLGNVGDAEDAAAETFTAMLAAIGRFRWLGVPFEAWLFRIASSKIVDIARRRQRAPLDGDDALADFPALGSDHADPALLAATAEANRELFAAMEQLPRDQREVLVLRFFADQPIRAVASSLGRSEGAVKQLQFRAMARLKRTLDR